jgi:predicted permease
MMTGRLWRIVEARLRRRLPPAHLESTIGDLAEDYLERRGTIGGLRAGFWLLGEAWSLRRAHVPASAAHWSMRTAATEVHFAARRLRARPLPALACAGLLGLGIGFGTAAFSAVDAVLLRPAPFPNHDRLIEQGLWRVDARVMEAWRESGMVERVEAGQPTTAQFDAASGARVWPAARVTPGVFDLLGVRPVLGRPFARPGSAPVPPDEILIGEAVWEAAFGADPAVVGRRVAFGGDTAVVVGVMPGTFRFPQPSTVVWIPFEVPSGAPGGFWLYGLLRPGVPREDAEARFDAIARDMNVIPSNYSRRSHVPLHPLGDADLEPFADQALWMVLGGAGMAFVVLCANVSSLLLAGLSGRRQEFAMCAALGASRGRLVREAVIEHSLIGLAGAAAGVWIAWGLTSVMPLVFQGHTLNPIDVDGRALALASVLGIAAVLISGLTPAWLGTRADAGGDTRVSRQAATDTRTSRLAARGLLTLEVALACSLLVGSAVLARSFVSLAYADRGMDGDGVTRVSIQNLDDATGSRESLRLAMEDIEATFTGWSTVETIALSREVPPDSWGDGVVHFGPPGSRPDPDAVVRTDVFRVTGSFFDVYRIPIRRGRPFGRGDSDVDAIVSGRLADLLWPGLDPIGRTFSFGAFPDARRVVGVAGDITLPTIDPARDLPELYSPLGDTSRTLYLNLRCRGECPTEAALDARVRSVHPTLRARLTTPAEDTYAAQLELPRATAEVGTVFATVAIVTAAAGLFCVLTLAVGRRRREFGVRVALGASPRQVQRLVLREGLTTVAVGVAAGSLGGWFVARLLSAFHYGVTATDPVAWGAVLAAVTITSIAASWLPSRQAARIDPAQLLRQD